MPYMTVGRRDVTTIDTPTYGKVAIYRSTGDSSGYAGQWFPFEGWAGDWWIKPLTPARWMLCDPSEYDEDDQYNLRMGCNEELTAILKAFQALPDDEKLGRDVNPNHYKTDIQKEIAHEYLQLLDKREEVELENKRRAKRGTAELKGLRTQLDQISRVMITNEEEWAQSVRDENTIEERIRELERGQLPLKNEFRHHGPLMKAHGRKHDKHNQEHFYAVLKQWGWERDPLVVRKYGEV